MSDQQVNHDVQKLVDYGEQLKGHHEQLQGLEDNPLGVLQSLNIEVENEFKDAVTSQLREFADITRSQTDGEGIVTLATSASDAQKAGSTAPAPPNGFRFAGYDENEQKPKPVAPAPPSGLRVVVEPASNDVPAEVFNALQFMIKPWGIVLAVHKPAMQYLKGGATITDATLGAAALLLPLIPVAGPILSGITAFLAFFLTVNIGVIEIMDQGKGVYITLTWLHIVYCGVGLLVPAITPIK
ncbi:MAG: hypothetical protein VST71_10590 [Nitrospirota bacterium]|nr:hypothetical protein [Nitrospirota bacterium]